MDSKFVPITKFQKDLSEYIEIYNSFIIEGSIDDYQVFRIRDDENNETLSGPVGIMDFFSNAFSGNEYLIFSYDCAKLAGNRVQFLESPGTDYSDDDKKRIQEIVSFINTGSKGLSLNYEKNNPIYSVELSRIHNVLTSKEFNKENSVPLMFVFSNCSLISACGNADQPITGYDEKDAYSAMLEITKDLAKLGAVPNKAFFLGHSYSEFPPFLSNEERNANIKGLTIMKPDTDLRKTLILDEINNSDSPVYAGYRDSDSPDTARQEDINAFVALTNEFYIKKLYQLFDYIANEKTSANLTEKTPAGQKTYTLHNGKEIIDSFNNGTTAKNPWDDEGIFGSIAEFASETKKIIIGQDEAVDKIAGILGQAVTGINRVTNKKAPRVILFLAGPTGTGKTEMSKVIAKKIFGSEDRMIRFDMSEFLQEHSDQRLFGAPPGYVGYDAGGELTNAILENPFSLVLFDEIEKANGKILDKFLQILSDGRLTDGRGRTVSFENSIIIMTSNAGLSQAMSTSPEALRQLESDYKVRGISREDADLSVMQKIEEAGNKLPTLDGKGYRTLEYFRNNLDKYVMANLSNYFEYQLNRKELFGRLNDGIVVYNYISKDGMEKIAESTVNKFIKDAAANHGITIDDEQKKLVLSFVWKACNDYDVRKLGGRGINKKVQSILGSAISNAMIELKRKSFAAGTKMVFETNENNSSLIGKIIEA